jgi:hypothetical protein
VDDEWRLLTNPQLCLPVPSVPDASSRSKEAAGDCSATESLIHSPLDISYFASTASKATARGFFLPQQGSESLALQLIYWTAGARDLI